MTKRFHSNKLHLWCTSASKHKHLLRLFTYLYTCNSFTGIKLMNTFTFPANQSSQTEQKKIISLIPVMQRVILKEFFLESIMNMNYVWFLVMWFNTEDRKPPKLIYGYFQERILQDTTGFTVSLLEKHKGLHAFLKRTQLKLLNTMIFFFYIFLIIS